MAFNPFNDLSFGKLRRYRHILTHSSLLTMNMGELRPLYWEETLPGDKFSVRVESFTRFLALIAPIMHRCNMRLYAFYVPNRVCLDSFGVDSRFWENFITGGESGNYERPINMIIDLPDLTTQQRQDQVRLFDNLNYFPQSVNLPYESSNLIPWPYLAYGAIWNEYFRDENLQSPVMPTFGLLDDSQITVRPTYGLLNKCWEKDYFTSALPWLQRGNPADLPVSFGTSSVETKISDKAYEDGGEYMQMHISPDAIGEQFLKLQNDGTISYTPDTNNIRSNPTYPTNLASFLKAETTLNEIEAFFTMNDFRRAMALQKWLERSARGGARYSEQIKSFFGVTSSDSRLQRPEFLGATSTPVSISEVLQTSATQSDSPLGQMGGHGLSAASNYLFRNKFCEEHGIIMVLATVVPRSAYFGGTDRRLWKPDRFHYYWPQFAKIGDQLVHKAELVANPGNSDSGNDDRFTENDGFGYQRRYIEYMQRPDEIHGDFTKTLSYWHLGRTFDKSVELNENIVKCVPKRDIYAVQDDPLSPQHGVLAADNILCQSIIHVDALRPVLKTN